MPKDSTFRKTFQKIVSDIKIDRHRTMKGVQEDLGEAIGKSVHTIDRFYRGNIPQESDIKKLATAMTQKFGVKRTVVEDFLKDARYPHPKALCDDLYGPAVADRVVTPPNVVSKNGPSPALASVSVFASPQHGMHGDPVAVRDEPSTRQQAYCAQVIDAITSRLTALGESALIDSLAEEMQRLAAGATLDINRDSKPDVLARQIATCIVEYRPVEKVVVSLIRLMRDQPLERANKLADIIDYVLPLNYAPDVLQRLHTQMTKERFGLVESTVTMRTLAEIIMAGYDQKPAEFVVMTDGRPRIRGVTALDYLQEPEEGPSLLPAVRNFFYELLALVDVTPARAGGIQDETALKKEIEFYAKRLTGRLQARSERHDDRTMYCVLKLPEASRQRDIYKQVLRTISEELDKISKELGPQNVALVFVELMELQADAWQDKMDDHIAYIQHNIRARYVRTP